MFIIMIAELHFILYNIVIVKVRGVIFRIGRTCYSKILDNWVYPKLV